MNDITGERHRLKYHPFPYADKRKKEYIIGEALLRSKMISDEEMATIRNVSSDPPDLIVKTKECGEIGIEITEHVAEDRNSVARSNEFIGKLKSHLSQLGTRPSKPANLWVYRERFAFPRIPPKKILSIAKQIDGFFASKDFPDRYEIIQEVVKSPIRITYIPALGGFALPPEFYDNNLFVHDATGYPINSREIENSFTEIVRKKTPAAKTADILVIFHGILGILGISSLDARLNVPLLHELKHDLLLNLPHKGIYIVGILESSDDYWINVVTIREHPIFEQNK